MSAMYSLVEQNGEETLTVIIPGESPQVVPTDHPNKDEILTKLREKAPADEIRELCDVSLAVAKHFRHLSDRVSVANGRVYFDGDEVESSLTKQIVRFLDTGQPNWRPLVLFMEKLAANPVPHTQHRLFGWLDARDFTIAEDGDFIAYKGVTNGTPPRSIHSGPGIVNGVATSGQLDNSPGNTVEMPRSDVQHDPARGCSTGLHAGTFEFAESFGRGSVVTVKVSPTDVVSVPTDSGDQKVRVCRYKVLHFAKQAYEAPLVADDSYHEFDLGD